MPDTPRRAHSPKIKPPEPKRPTLGVSENDFALPLNPKQKVVYGTLAAASTEAKTGDTSTTPSIAPLLEDSISTHQSDSHQTTFDDTVPMTPTAFRRLLGLKAHADAGASPSELEAGHGLYHDIRVSYEAAKRAHLWFEIGIYTSLLGQVLLSANFIIPRAMSGDQHVPIAVLGAFSVSIAGCLALVKGQGLPMRLRMVSLVRPPYEELMLIRCRSATPSGKFNSKPRSCTGASQPAGLSCLLSRAIQSKRANTDQLTSLADDVKQVWERFVQVKRDASLNHPDTGNSSASAAAQPVTVATKPVVSGGQPVIQTEALIS